MSGVRMRVLFDDAPLRAHLARMALYNAAKFGALLRDVGEDMVGDVHDNIRAQRLVGGSPMPQSAAARKRKGKTLQDHGHLRDSYTYQVGGASLQVGSNMVYAAIHHFGGMAGKGRKTEILARPVLGMSDKRERTIGDMLLREIQGAA